MPSLLKRMFLTIDLTNIAGSACEGCNIEVGDICEEERETRDLYGDWVCSG